MKKVSVIIPIYNVEAYLPRALDSLLAQTYDCWEAVMVDDGSTDGSGHIARQYCNRDKRFRLTRQENQGQGAARNKAMEQVGGDYKCSHRLGLGDVSPRPRHYRDYPYHVTDNIFRHATESSHPQGVDRRWTVRHCQAWRCLLSADLARKARFAEGLKYEDVPWWGEVLLNVRQTTITRLPLYFYYPNPHSFVMSAGTAEHIRSLSAILRQTDNLFQNATPEQRTAWNLNFRKPYSRYLEKKLHRHEKT